MVKNEETVIVKIVNEITGEGNLIKEKNLVSEVRKANGDLSRTYEKQTSTQRKRITVNKIETETGQDVYSVQKEILAQGPKFQTHYLGVMFAGMALNRAMSNLTATSKEWVGVNEVLSTALGVVMLPATLAFLDEAVLPLSDALMKLPENMQLAIGAAALFGEGLGSALEFGGQIILGASAFKIAFPELAKKISSGLSSKIGKGVGATIGVTLTVASISMLIEGINSESMALELAGLLGTAFGLGVTGFSFAGITGGIIGFTLGVGVGLIIEWSIKENKWKSKAKELGIDDKTIGEHVFRSTLLGGILGSGKSPSSSYSSKAGAVDFALGSSSFQGFAVGGQVTSSGLHYLHEGETVLRKDQTNNNGGNMSIVYNVTVSDKREFEAMLRKNNESIKNEVRRIVKI